MEQWVQLLAYIVSTVGILLWFRRESREDRERLLEEAREDRNRGEYIILSIREDPQDFKDKLLKIEKKEDIL